MKNIYMCLCMVACLATVYTLEAGFQDSVAGVRPAGMGQAFVSVADDANTVLFNPAGFAQIQKLELIGMYSDLYSNLNPGLFTNETDRLGYNFISLGVPVSDQIGSFGMAWTNFTSTIYKENIFTLSYGRLIWKKHNLKTGINIKVLQWMLVANEFTSDKSLFPYSELYKMGFTLDLGILGEPVSGLQVGLALDNLIPANMALEDEEIVPVVIRLGGTYQVPIKIPDMDVLQTTLELNIRAEVANVKMGAEAWFFQRRFAVRTGFNLDEITFGLSLGNHWSRETLGTQLDYAFSYPLMVNGTFGSHRVGLTLHWDMFAKPKKEQPEKIVVIKTKQIPAEESKEYKRMQAEVENLQAQVKALDAELLEFKKQIKIGILKPILFNTSKNNIRPSAYPTLDYLGTILKKYPILLVRIEGHTDSKGDYLYNLKLSQRRMEAVQKYLVEKMGIDPDHLVPVGYGESRPIASNKTKAGRKQNRRVEFKVINPYAKKKSPKNKNKGDKSPFKYRE
jgi:outer membrane protein OmpA-like peptidoglycan-associated protein